MNEELRFNAPRPKKRRVDFVHPDLLGSQIDWEAILPESYDGEKLLSTTIDEHGLWPSIKDELKLYNYPPHNEKAP